MRILYLHGWMTGPKGYKVEEIRKEFPEHDILCLDMELGILNPVKKNTILRVFLKQNRVFVISWFLAVIIAYLIAKWLLVGLFCIWFVAYLVYKRSKTL